MNYRAKYDELIKQSIGQQHLLKDYPYYDEVYCSVLNKFMADNGYKKAFGALEFRDLKYGRIKICSVASSSRIGFFYGLQNGIYGFEYTDVHNGICKPHYDNFDSNNNVFFEYKCHEFVSDNDKNHNRFTSNLNEYVKLLVKHFPKLEKVDTNNLFSTFGIEACIYFDFKQLICHILGLLSIAEIDAQVKLRYIMFIPKVSILALEENNEISLFLDSLKEQIKGIFETIGEIDTVNCRGEKGILTDFVELNFEYIDVSKVDDFIYRSCVDGKSIIREEN